jgi:hypothetical protein
MHLRVGEYTGVYRLSCVVFHVGERHEDATQHYFTLCRFFGNDWYRSDPASVKDQKLTPVERLEDYLLGRMSSDIIGLVYVLPDSCYRVPSKLSLETVLGMFPP